MRHIIIAVLFVFSVVPGAAQDKPATAKLEDLAWLSGGWEGGGFEEHWMKPAGGTMIGMGRMVQEGATVFIEFLKIEESEGSIYYRATVEGQPEASFKLAKLGKNEVVFENPEHDFPQRIIYRQPKAGELHARIEGGKGDPQDWVLQKMR